MAQPRTHPRHTLNLALCLLYAHTYTHAHTYTLLVFIIHVSSQAAIYVYFWRMIFYKRTLYNDSAYNINIIVFARMILWF